VPVTTAQSFRLINVPEASGMPNEVFQAKIKSALNKAVLPTIHARPGHADTGYIENDWKAHPDGRGYLASSSLSRRSDLQGAADSLYASLGPEIAAVEDKFAAEHGWTPD
jgi:hypothetical protein